MRIVRKKNKGSILLQYNNVKDFDRLKIRKISDIQFFNRCIDGTKFPCLMIEYIAMCALKERKLYQFETEKARRDFFRSIMRDSNLIIRYRH